MKFGEKVHYRVFKWFVSLRALHGKAWNGVSILVFRHDSAHTPVKRRINFYVLIFLSILIAAPPIAALSIMLERKINGEDPQEIVENKLLLLHAMRLFTMEKKLLLLQANRQIHDIRNAGSTDRNDLFVSYARSRMERMRREQQSGINDISQDLNDLRNLKFRAQAMRETAFHSLRLVWNRISIHDIMPRRRPLREGDGYLSSDYGDRWDPIARRKMRKEQKEQKKKLLDVATPTSREFHRGIDIAAGNGTPILATAPGVVLRAVNKITEGYGRFLEIHHGMGYISLYAHCSEVLVEKGDRIRRGQIIAKVGRTGRVTGAHVHYEIRLGRGYPINPLPYMRLR